MEKTLNLPIEFILFMGLVAVCLIFRRHQLGLLGTYAFVFYLGFLFNENYFILSDGNTSWTAYLYGVSGIWVVGIVLYGLMKENKTSQPLSSQSSPSQTL